MSNVAAGDALSTLLISDKKKQASEFRIRNSSYNFTSVHSMDADGLVAKGWVVQRVGKRKTRLKREKPHSQRLEDRIWCLLYKMGYHCLNTVQHNNNNFLKYNEKIFSWDDQARLRDAVIRARDKGVAIAVTNADHATIRSLYDGVGDYRQLYRHSVLASDATKRGATTEALFLANINFNAQHSSNSSLP